MRAPCSALVALSVSARCVQVIGTARRRCRSLLRWPPPPPAAASPEPGTPLVSCLYRLPAASQSTLLLLPARIAGREVVGQLLCSPRWSSVTAVGRRTAEAPAEYKDKQGYDASKLHNVTVSRAARLGFWVQWQRMEPGRAAGRGGGCVGSRRPSLWPQPPAICL